MTKILHLTHTDITSDSRILKEMSVMNDVGNNVNGIGIYKENSRVSNLSKNLNLYSIVLKSKKLPFLPLFIRHVFSFLELLVKMVNRAIKINPKIIHCNDILVLPIGVIIKLITGSKLIYDAHELESNRNGLTRIEARLTLFFEKLLWRSIDALIVVSPSIDSWYAQNIGKKYSQVILNSPLLESGNITDNKSYLRDYFSISERSKIFLYIGILSYGRGIDLILDAFKDSDCASSVVFLGYGELSNNIKEISKKHPNIYFHDAVPHEEVVPIARSADVGLCLIQNVSLSDYYCLPNKLFEYCFSGIPVLASNFPDISNTVNSYKLGECCDLDLTSIKQSIHKFEKGEVDTDFNVSDLIELSWQTQGEKLIKLYDYVLHR